MYDVSNRDSFIGVREWVNMLEVRLNDIDFQRSGKINQIIAKFVQYYSVIRLKRFIQLKIVREYFLLLNN